MPTLERPVEDLFAEIRHLFTHHKEGLPPGLEIVRLDKLEPLKITQLMPDWKYHPVGGVVQGAGRPAEGRYEQWGWNFKYTEEGAAWDLTITSMSHHKDVTLSHGGIREFQVDGIDSVQIDTAAGRISFLGTRENYHIDQRGLVHSTERNGVSTGFKSFHPQGTPGAVVPAA